MSSEIFTKENLDLYLKELAKAFRKRNGKSMPAEIVLVGGAAILSNYGFRNMTTDIDAVIHAASTIKDAINDVGDKFSLPSGWINADFMQTASYTPKLNEYSVYYKSFYGVLTIRTITAEYLIAMKLRAGRKYKNDLSDVIGILVEHDKKGAPITFEKIEEAVKNLYGGWEAVPADAKVFIEEALRNENLENIFTSIKKEENESKDILITFEQNYPKVIKESNVNEILKSLKEKRN